MTHCKIAGIVAMALCGLVLTLPLAANQAQAGQSVPRQLTIDEAITLALANNGQLKAAAIDQAIRQRAVDTAWSVLVPTVQVSGTVARVNTYSNPLAGFPGMPPAPDPVEADHWSAMGNVSASLNFNLAIFEGFRATKLQQEAGLISLEQTRAQTRQNVSKAFYGLLLQQQSLALARGKLRNAEERLVQVRTNHRNGLVSELSLLQAELNVETQRPQIMEAELNLTQQKSMLAFLLGLPVDQPLDLVGAIEPVIAQHDAEALLATHLDARLDLELLRTNIAAMQSQASATALQIYTPSLALSQSWIPRTIKIDSDWLSSDSWRDGGNFNATIVFNLSNLLPFSSAQKGYADLRDNIAKLELSLAQARTHAQMEVRNMVRRLDKIASSLRAMELNVKTAERAFQLSEQGYRVGSVEYLDLKDAENMLMQARLGVLSERFNYLSTLIDLETALNIRSKP
jgi:outer membrane protein TolC